jgi:hypothetical protein
VGCVDPVHRVSARTWAWIARFLYFLAMDFEISGPDDLADALGFLGDMVLGQPCEWTEMEPYYLSSQMDSGSKRVVAGGHIKRRAPLTQWSRAWGRVRAFECGAFHASSKGRPRYRCPYHCLHNPPA